MYRTIERLRSGFNWIGSGLIVYFTTLLTVPRFKELAIQKEDNIVPNNWPEVDVCVKSGLKLPDVLHIPEVLNRIQSRHEQPHFENQPNLDWECFKERERSDLKNEEFLTCNRNVAKINSGNDNINTGTELIGSVSDLGIDLRQLCVSKNSTVSQKEKHAVTNDPDRYELSNRKLQNSGGNKRRTKDKNSDDKPTYAQLETVANYYEIQIKSLHARSEDFSRGLHHRNIIFENNYSRMPASCQGVDKYGMALAKMRILGSLSYFTFRFQPINITSDMDEGAVILHWRVYYINNLRFFTNAAPRALMDRSLKNIYDEDEAISTFYLNGNGQIVKHKVDKTIPLKGEKKVVGLKARLRKRFNMALN